jgi:hypothetical protein
VRSLPRPAPAPHRAVLAVPADARGEHPSVDGRKDVSGLAVEADVGRAVAGRPVAVELGLLRLGQQSKRGGRARPRPPARAPSPRRVFCREGDEGTRAPYDIRCLRAPINAAHRSIGHRTCRDRRRSPRCRRWISRRPTSRRAACVAGAISPGRRGRDPRSDDGRRAGPGGTPGASSPSSRSPTMSAAPGKMSSVSCGPTCTARQRSSRRRMSWPASRPAQCGSTYSALSSRLVTIEVNSPTNASVDSGPARRSPGRPLRSRALSWCSGGSPRVSPRTTFLVVLERGDEARSVNRRQVTAADGDLVRSRRRGRDGPGYRARAARARS